MSVVVFLFALTFTAVSYGHSVHQPPTPAPAPTPEPVITHDSHHSRTVAAMILTGLVVYYLMKENKVDLKIKSQPGDDR